MDRVAYFGHMGVWCGVVSWEGEVRSEVRGDKKGPNFLTHHQWKIRRTGKSWKIICRIFLTGSGTNVLASIFSGKWQPPYIMMIVNWVAN